MYAVRPLEKPFSATVRVPGSKSHTHRMLIAAALAEGPSTLENALDSEDTRLTAAALAKMGVALRSEGGLVRVEGCHGRLKPCGVEINLGNSGTSMRLLAAVAALGRSPYRLTGGARMQQRPLGDLLASLTQMGVAARSTAGTGCPPVEICGPPMHGGGITVNCRWSSQYLSALMLIAPLVPGGLVIDVVGGPVSRPYVDITADVMGRFGIDLDRRAYNRFSVRAGQTYRGGSHRVPPDASQAGYFWAAAALTGSRVTLSGFGSESKQGDLRFLDLLAAMGCRVLREVSGITVVGGLLRAVDADMSDMPDVAPTLAVVAAFADGVTRLRGVGHLAIKESDRLSAVIDGLRRMGIAARHTGEDMVIDGGRPTGATIEACGDHRIAMSFALAGLRVPGVVIDDPECVAKSFPGFWQVFESLYG